VGDEVILTEHDEAARGFLAIFRKAPEIIVIHSSAINILYCMMQGA